MARNPLKRRPVHRVLVAAGALLPLAGVLALGVATSPEAALAQGAPFHVEQQRGNSTWFLHGISCAPGTSDCWVVGARFGLDGNVLSSTNGGLSWTSQTMNLPSGTSNLPSGVPAGINGIRAISCPSATTCFAGGSVASGSAGTFYPAMVETANGGSSWTPLSLPTSIETSGSGLEIGGVSCPDTTHCFAVGGVPPDSSGSPIVVATTDGSNWSAQSPPSTTGALNAVSCATDSDCVAVGGSGSIIATANGGTSWTTETSGTTSLLTAVSCPTATTCVATGYSGTILVTTDATSGTGATWTAETSGTTNDLGGVSCAPGTSDCFAAGAGGTILATTTATSGTGATWAAETSGVSNALDAVACTSNQACVVAGGVRSSLFRTSSTQVGASPVLATTDGGTHWSVTRPGGPNKLNAVNCIATTCYAVGDTGPAGGPGSSGNYVEKTSNGVSWSGIYSGPEGTGALHDISCADALHCVAVGGQDRYSGGAAASIVETNDGGTTWTSETPGTTQLLWGVACSSANDCTAVGFSGTIIATADATSGTGATWTAETSNTTSSLYSIACPSASVCYAAGYAIVDKTTNATFGTPPGTGATWAVTTSGVPSAWEHKGISCPDTTHCFIAGDSGNVGITTNGTSWSTVSAYSTPHGADDLHGMSCTSDTTCVASGGGGFYTTGSRSLLLETTDGGTSWSPLPPPPNEGGVVSVSCDSAGCWAVGERGVIESTFEGSPPSQAAPVVSTVSPSSGPSTGATMITLTGANLANAAYVLVGGVDATTVVDVSPTEVTALTPAGKAGSSEPVQVITPGGTSPSAGAPEFTYTTPPPAYYPVSPTRICDTRPGNPSGLSGGAAQCAGKTLSAAGPLTVQVTGNAGVPAGATAAVVNLTAISPSSAGTLSAYPAGEPVPATQSVSFAAGETRAGLVEVGLSPTGALDVATSVSSVYLAVDVEGYVAPETSAGSLYSALGAPARICDTRAGNPSQLSGEAAQCQGSTLAPGAPLVVQVTGVGGVPAGATAAVLNVTGVKAAEPGYLSAYPSNEGAPVVSNLNFGANEVVANRVVVPLSPAGQVSFVSDASTNLVVDVSGYFTTGAGATGTAFTPEPDPARIATLTVPGGSTKSVQVVGQAGVPASAKAVVVTVTVTSTTEPSFLTVYPGGTLPVVSDLNWSAGQSASNLVIATLPSSGAISLYNYTGSASVEVDVLGWYS